MTHPGIRVRLRAPMKGLQTWQLTAALWTSTPLLTMILPLLMCSGWGRRSTVRVQRG